MKNKLKNTLNLQDKFESLLQVYPSWCQKQKQSAWQNFQARGLPNKKQEAWKYTNLSFLARRKVQIIDKASELIEAKLLKKMQEFSTPSEDPLKILLLNGRLIKKSFRPENLPQGLQLDTLENRLHSSNCLSLEKEEALNEELDELNEALAFDGVFLQVEKNRELKEELHFFIHLEDKAKPEAIKAAFLNNKIHLKENSQAKIWLHFGSLKDKETRDDFEINLLHNIKTAITLEKGAKLELYIVQEETLSSVHLSCFKVVQEKNSCLNVFTLATGASLGRQSILTLQKGSHCQTKLYGLALAKGKQHQDQQTKVNHFISHGKSDQFYKAIADDAASSVFGGVIKIKQDAQKIRAYQLSKNLLMSEKAQAYSKPQLEIDADDVKCSHGATIAPLRKEEIFYLKTRAISQKKAESLLALSFGKEVFTSVPAAKACEYLQRLIYEALREKSSDGLKEKIR